MTELSKERFQTIKWLWEKFSKLYGNAFVTIHGALPNEIWIEALQSLTEKRIITTVHEVIAGKSGHENFPPNAAQFAAFARQVYVDNTDKAEPVAAITFRKVTEEEKAEEEKRRLAVGNRYLEEIKKKLGMPTVKNID